jgi:hypothetical protein
LDVHRDTVHVAVRKGRGKTLAVDKQVFGSDMASLIRVAASEDSSRQKHRSDNDGAMPEVRPMGHSLHPWAPKSPSEKRTIPPWIQQLRLFRVSKEWFGLQTARRGCLWIARRSSLAMRRW